MSFEYQLVYLRPQSIASDDFGAIEQTLNVSGNKDFDIHFLKKENGDLVYGFKFKETHKHTWVWDGLFYLNPLRGHIAFHTGTKTQIDSFINYMEETLKKVSVTVIVKED